MTNAFVVRIAVGGPETLQEALKGNELILGWSEARGLTDLSLDWEGFRKIVGDVYHPDQTNLAKAGAAAGNLWRFIREMQEGDLVVVPSGDQFYAAEVVGPARYDESKAVHDTAHRRPVRWLNERRPIPRRWARAALLSRLKARQTCARAGDLELEIRRLLNVAKVGAPPPFREELRTKLIAQVREEMCEGRFDSYAFERLVAEILRVLGASCTKITARRQDKGADILATFTVARTFELIVAVQVKHHRPDPPLGVDVVDQLVRGMDDAEVTHGCVATSGSFSEAARKRKKEIEEARGIEIELLDGIELAALVVDSGLRDFSGLDDQHVRPE